MVVFACGRYQFVAECGIPEGMLMARSPARLVIACALFAGFVVTLPNPARGHVTLNDPNGGEEGGEPQADQIENCIRETLQRQRVEAAVLDRSLPMKTKFRLLSTDELATVLAPYTS